MRTIAFVCKAASRRTEKHLGVRGFADQLASAVGEAFNNVALHGYGKRLRGDVLISVSFDRTHVRVELTDDGQTFDPGAVAEPDLDLLPESGMGLYIIRSFVDELEYSPGPPNVLTLTKRFGASSVQG